MAYGGPAGDPQVTSDLNTVRAWQRKLNAGTLEWPLDTEVWDGALNKGRGRGPIRHLRLLADRLAWIPAVGGWRCEDQFFTWGEADYKVKWDSARVLLTKVATSRPHFGGLETGLSTQSVRHLKRSANRTEDSFRSAFNASLGGVWHEVRTDNAFHVGELCVRCKEEPEDLSHI
eukprot:6336395-Amphidinium_carterae.1